MSLSKLEEKYRSFAFAAADLLVETDLDGRIVFAAGDAGLLHHPSADRLAEKNVFQLIAFMEADALRARMTNIAPGRRFDWDDPSFGHAGRRVSVHRGLMDPSRLLITFARASGAKGLNADGSAEMLVDRFRTAVANRNFAAALQPVVDARTGRLSHHEVLVRFDGSESPARMIAAAEQRGLISDLDCTMVAAVAGKLADPNADYHKLAVNVSGVSIQRKDVVDELRKAITGHGFAPNRMIVEITESSQIEDLETAATSVNALRETGVEVALDDFGAGSASFGYLRAMDVTGLKFDGAFLSEGGSSRRSNALMRNIARMCGELGLSSVGERVETEADRQLLISAGVSLAQGYFFGRPEYDAGFFSIGAPKRAAA